MRDRLEPHSEGCAAEGDAHARWRPCPVSVAAVEVPSRVAVTFAGMTWTWAQVDSAVASWTHHLASHGVREGDPLAVLSYNRPELLFALFAAARLGAWVVPLNARLSAAELQPLIERVSPRRVLVDPPLLAQLTGCEARVLRLDAPLAAAPHAAPARWLDDGPLLGLFTSGTTGRPKLALQGIRQLEAASKASSARIGGEGAVWLGTLPLFHVGGLAMVFRVLFDRGTLALHARFDPHEVNEALDTAGITHASLVPTTLARLLDARGERRLGEGLRAVLIGGGPMSPALLERARHQGLPCLQTYGMTEACSQLTTERPDSADGGSAGPPLDGTDLRIVDDEGRVQPPGVEGRIEVRGPTLFQGYFGDPQATEEAWSSGWFITGDLGVLDEEGRLRLLSRRTDLIVRGGENVYPAELEHVLEQHPAVREAAVLSLPDARWGQVAIAIVVFEGEDASSELDPWLRTRLASFKIPEAFHRIDVLPRNAMGKLDRVALRRWLEER